MMLQTISLYFSALFPPSKKFYCIAADGFDCACFRETRTEQECSVLRHRSRMRVTVIRTMQWISKRPRVRKNIEILFLQHLFTLTQRRTSKMLTLSVCHYLRYEKYAVLIAKPNRIWHCHGRDIHYIIALLVAIYLWIIFAISRGILGKCHHKQAVASWRYSRLFEPIPEGLGCGDKHSVVDSDKNSAKRVQ